MISHDREHGKNKTGKIHEPCSEVGPLSETADTDGHVLLSAGTLFIYGRESFGKGNPSSAGA